MILVRRGAAPGRGLMVCWRSSSSWLDWSGSAGSSLATCEIHARVLPAEGCMVVPALLCVLIWAPGRGS